jgi:protein gp37
MALRLAHIDSTDYYGEVLKIKGPNMGEKVHAVWNGTTRLVQSALNKPLKWKKPRVIFVCSMGDLFHEDAGVYEIRKVFEIMVQCRQHVFIVLTKRPENILPTINLFGWGLPLPPNVWLGVTAENQQTANERLPYLIKIPAAVKFVSVEPMLGPVNISMWFYSGYMEPPQDDVIDWVICGGESGPGARPMHPDWARSLRNQCRDAYIPFFFKQWGEWIPWEFDAQPPFMNSQNGRFEDGHTLKIIDGKTGDTAKNWDDGMWCIVEGFEQCLFEKVGRKTAGNLLDGEKWEQYPNQPASAGGEKEVKN